MANNPIIINQGPPLLQGQAQVNLRRDDFNAAVWNKGTEVYVEKAMRCPCKPAGDQPLSSCVNCGGMGWFYIQKRTTRMILQGANLKWSFKEWSEEDSSRIGVTTLVRDNLAVMDRITVRSAVSFFTQPIHLRYDSTLQALVGRAFYEIIEVTEAFLFIDPKKPLVRLVRDVDYSTDGNTIFVDKRFRTTETTTITIRYNHNPQYHIENMTREFITQLQRSFTTGSLDRDKFPIHSMAQKAHYCFDQLNYFDNSGDPLEFIDNSYEPDPCETPAITPTICTSPIDDSNINRYSLLLNGVDELVRVSVVTGSPLDFNPSSVFTISFWMKMDRLGAFMNIYNKFDNNINVGSLMLINPTGQLVFNLRGPNAQFLIVETSNSIVQLNQWQHVTMTYDGSATAAGVEIYIDGVRQTKQVRFDDLSLTDNLQVNNPVLIGGYSINGSPNNTFRGLLDEVIVWDRVLSLSNVLSEVQRTDVNSVIHSGNVIYHNQLGDFAAWDGVRYTFPDLSRNNYQSHSINLEQSSRSLDIPFTAS